MDSRYAGPSSLRFPAKIFVKSSEKPDESCRKKVDRKRGRGFDGEKAKEFYESVTSSGNETIKKAKVKTVVRSVEKSKPANVRKVVLSSKKFFEAANKDDHGLIRRALAHISSEAEKERFFNQRDPFGWTGVMVAAGAGALNTVKLLVEVGGVESAMKPVDKRDRSCMDIASYLGYHQVVDYLKQQVASSSGSTSSSSDTSSADTSSNLPTFCDVCRVETGPHPMTHFKSLSHLLEQNRKDLKATGGRPKVHYVIPEANRGFQMMLSKGWDSNKGLGPEGSGKLFPVKTVLKRDRHGLGLNLGEGSSSNNQNGSPASEVKRAKVTHFGPNDSSSVKDKPSKRLQRVSTLTRSKLMSKKCREKIKETEFRREFL